MLWFYSGLSVEIRYISTHRVKIRNKIELKKWGKKINTDPLPVFIPC